MPSPIAHLSMGAFLWVCLKDVLGEFWQRTAFRRVGLLGMFLVFSMLPDFDAVAGILLGDFGAYHNQESHSILFGLVASALLAAGAARLFPEASFGRWLVVIGVSYQLHLLMDFFTSGRGLRLLWPVEAERVSPPRVVFGGLEWSEGVWYAGHWVTVGEEMAFALVLLMCYLLTRRGLERLRRRAVV